MKPKKVRTLKVRGRRFRVWDNTHWDIEKNGHAGQCVNVKGMRVLEIPADGDMLGDLIVIVHEICHAGLWDLDEDAVDELSDSIGTALWKLGWRKEHHE